MSFDHAFRPRSKRHLALVGFGKHRKIPARLTLACRRTVKADVYNLGLKKKGDILSLDVVAYAGAEYSRIRLVQITGVVDKDGEVQF